MNKKQIKINLFLCGKDDDFDYEIEVPNNFEKWNEDRQDEYIENYIEKHDAKIRGDICISRER